MPAYFDNFRYTVYFLCTYIDVIADKLSLAVRFYQSQDGLGFDRVEIHYISIIYTSCARAESLY